MAEKPVPHVWIVEQLQPRSKRWYPDTEEVFGSRETAKHAVKMHRDFWGNQIEFRVAKYARVEVA